MSQNDWIKELVVSEQKMEEFGIVDIQGGIDNKRILSEETVEFLKDLRAGFQQAIATFNQHKGNNPGQIKIYGISRTAADFMLFRNGFKIIFSFKSPGVLGVRMHYLAHPLLGAAGASGKPEEDLLVAKAGAFGEILQWTYQDQLVKIDSLVRYYLSRFVRESIK